MTKKFIFILAVCFLIFSCASDNVQEEVIEELPVVEEQVQNSNAPVELEPALDIVIDEEPDIVSVEEPEPEYFADSSQKEEYLRSISKLSEEGSVIVPPDVFAEDKDQIFLIINDLDRIMKKKDYAAWVGYLTPESKDYWSDRHNLLELSKMLFPNGEFRLNNLKEYFENFFILARRGRAVDEIRYVTPDYVKVVQYKNNTDIIYYFFERQEGEWKLWLDTL